MHSLFATEATFATSVLTLSVGAIVYARNPKNITNKLLFLLSFSFSVWMVSNFLSNQSFLSYNSLLFFNRLIFASSSLAVGLVPLFFRSFHSSKLISSRRQQILLGYILLLVILSFTEYFVAAIMVSNPVTEIEFGLLAPLYFFGVMLFIALSAYELLAAYLKSNDKTKKQLRVIGWATALALSLSLFTNAILPFFFGIYSLSPFGPLFYLVMIGGFAYSIARLQLFDLRLVLVRYISYITTLIVVILLYFLFSTSLVSGLFDITFNSRETIVILLQALLLLLGFYHLKRFFNKISISLFYRQFVEPQKLVGQLSEILVKKVEIDQILKLSSQLIIANLHISYCDVYLYNNKSIERRYTSAKIANDSLAPTEFAKLNRTHELVYLTDQDTNKIRAQVFRAKKVDIIVRLSSTTSKVGYIVLGPKRSGNIYTVDDVELLRTLSGNLSIALENAIRYEEILLFNKKLELEIKNATAQLEVTNKTLKRLDKMKNDFISATTHQLRPQLAASKGFLEIVLSQNNNFVDSSRSNVQLAIRSIDRMSKIVIGILEPSLKGREELQLALSDNDLVELIKEEINQLKMVSKTRKVKILLDVPKTAKLKIDPEKIREAVYNIIDNAIQYSPQRSTIKVRLIKDENAKKYTFSVADRGIGLTENQSKRMFDKFYRSKKARIARPSGTGMGLYVTSMFVEAHQGDVFAKSNDKEVGSVVGFTLPVSK